MMSKGISARVYKRIVRRLGRRIDLVNPVRFTGSSSYWEERYALGGSSGAGSYSRLAEFKAEVLNSFVSSNQIETILELGCGDGNQLGLAKYPAYTGIDVSSSAISKCRRKFQGDPSKKFYEDTSDIQNSDHEFDLGISLDVIYHLVEDKIFHEYMQTLTNLSQHWIIIYSSDFDDDQIPSEWTYSRADHVKHRRFSKWMIDNADRWSLVSKISNKYPFQPSKPDETSFSDFYIFKRDAECSQ